MGTSFSGKIKEGILTNRRVANFHPKQIDFMREKFVLMCDDDLTLGKDIFADLVKMDKQEAAKVRTPKTEPNFLRFLSTLIWTQVAK